MPHINDVCRESNVGHVQLSRLVHSSFWLVLMSLTINFIQPTVIIEVLLKSHRNWRSEYLVPVTLDQSTQMKYDFNNGWQAATLLQLAERNK